MIKWNEKYKKEIVTNTIGTDFDLGKLKTVLAEYDRWLSGNHLIMRPFMNVRMDFLRYFWKTLDGEIPYHYYDSCHWIEESHGKKELYATFFRFLLSAKGWRDSITSYHSTEFKKYKRELSFKDVFGFVGNEKDVKRFKKRMKKI